MYKNSHNREDRNQSNLNTDLMSSTINKGKKNIFGTHVLL